MRKKRISCVIISTLLTASTLHAYVNEQDNVFANKNTIIPGEPIECGQLPVGYPQYAGVTLNCGYNFFGTAEFLLWTPLRSFMTPVTKNNTLTNDKLQLFETFPYRPGFKIGAGFSLPNFDEWTFSADYTWYHHDFSFRASASDSETLTPAHFTALYYFPYSVIENSTKFALDQAAVRVGRPAYIGTRLLIQPSLSITGIWFKFIQSEKLTLSPLAGSPGTDFQKEDFRMWSIGFSSSINGNLLLGKGFKLFGISEIALMYQRVTKDQQTVTATLLPTPIMKQGFDKSVIGFYPYGQGGMGLGWGQYFSQNRFYINCEISYKFTGLYLAAMGTNGILTNPGFYMHGVSIQGQLDF